MEDVYKLESTLIYSYASLLVLEARFTAGLEVFRGHLRKAGVEGWWIFVCLYVTGNFTQLSVVSSLAFAVNGLATR